MDDVVVDQPETPHVINSTEVDSGIEYRFNPVYHKFSDFLEVDRYTRDDIRIAEKLSFITDWAKKQTQSDNIVDITDFVDKLIKQSGVTFKGKTLVYHLYQQARLDIDKRRIQAERDAKKAKLFDKKTS